MTRNGLRPPEDATRSPVWALPFGATVPVHSRSMTIVLSLVSATLAASATPCDNATAVATIAPKSGEVPLTVKGQIFKPDGTSPAPGVIVYAYQTGADGDYARNTDGAPTRRAWMRTDADGRFTLKTIRPGPYPNHKEPAHIHFEFWGADTPPQWSNAMIFVGDKLTSATKKKKSKALGRFGFIVDPKRTKAGLQVEVAYRLKPGADRFQSAIKYGLEACGIDWRRPWPPKRPRADGINK